MKHGSLCTGYGGIDIALAQVLDAQTVWVSDVDKGANKVLAHRYPDVPNIGDMTAVDWSQVEPVDVLSGGYPCQPFSHAGKRKGRDDERNLWPYVREAIRVLRPRLTVLENVAGHRSLGFDRVLGDLAEDGMHVRWTSVRASDVGAPHRRERLFILVTPAESPDLGHERGRAPRGRRPGSADGGSGAVALLPTPRATDGTKGGPNQRGSSGDLMLPSAVQLLPTPAVNDMGEGKTVDAWDDWTARMKAKHGNGNGHGPSLSIEAQRLLPTPKATNNENRSSEWANGPNLGEAISGLLPTPTTEPTTGNGHARNLGAEVQQWGKYAAAVARWEYLTRKAPAPTEPGRNGKPRLSAAFCEWLMGLPVGWITDVPDITRNEALRLCGNGVVPQQCAAALTYLLSMESP